jgi:hypothetical protein
MELDFEKKRFDKISDTLTEETPEEGPDGPEAAGVRSGRKIGVKLSANQPKCRFGC